MKTKLKRNQVQISTTDNTLKSINNEKEEKNKIYKKWRKR